MLQPLLYLKTDDYLAQWFIHEQGGSQPVRLIKGSIESKLLNLFLTKQPEPEPSEDSDPREVDADGEPAADPEEEEAPNLIIEIPSFKNRPPEIFNYITPRAASVIVSVIRDRFDVKLWTDLYTFNNIMQRQDELIYAWMESNGIELTERNWNAIAKRYSRLRDRYRQRERAQKAYSSRKKE